MSLALAAVGAVLAALLQVTIAPGAAILGGTPNLLLVLVVVWTIAIGLDGGILIAFLGGIVLDSLAMRPLGSTAFTMLVVAGGAALLPRLITQGRTFLAVPGVLAASFVQPLLLHAILLALKGSGSFSDPAAGLVPAAIYNAILALGLGVAATRLHARYMTRERVGW